MGGSSAIYQHHAGKRLYNQGECKMSVKHKRHKEIKAWADGAEIEQPQAAEFQATTDLLCLQADNLKLRDGFKWLLDAIDENIASVNQYKVMEYQELLSTPPQSLQAHDDEVIERVVTLLKDSAWDDGIIDMRVDDLIEDVRKLKGK